MLPVMGCRRVGDGWSGCGDWCFKAVRIDDAKSNIQVVATLAKAVFLLRLIDASSLLKTGAPCANRSPKICRSHIRLRRLRMLGRAYEYAAVEAP